MKKIGLVIALSLFVLTLGTSMARKPAVEPVLGISIDEQRPVSPAQAQGFDFSSGKAKKLQGTVKNTPKEETTPWSLLALLALLPLAVSIAIIKKSRKIHKEATLPEAAIDLAKHRQEKEEKSKSWKKAS